MVRPVTKVYIVPHGLDSWDDCPAPSWRGEVASEAAHARGERWARVRCRCWDETVVKAVNDDGYVNDLWACPTEKCGVGGRLMLDGWASTGRA